MRRCCLTLGASAVAVCSETPGGCPGGNLRPRVKAQLGQRIRHVDRDGPLTQEEGFCDLAIRSAECHERCNFPLPLSQALELLAWPALVPPPPVVPAVGVQWRGPRTWRAHPYLRCEAPVPQRAVAPSDRPASLQSAAPTLPGCGREAPQPASVTAGEEGHRP